MKKRNLEQKTEETPVTLQNLEIFAVPFIGDALLVSDVSKMGSLDTYEKIGLCTCLMGVKYAAYGTVSYLAYLTFSGQLN